MNRVPHVGPLDELADDLTAMEADIYGIAALGREIARMFDAERRAAGERLRATIAAATVFSTLSGTSAAIGLGHTGAGALFIGVVTGLASASSALVSYPAPRCVGRAWTRARTWWRR